MHVHYPLTIAVRTKVHCAAARLLPACALLLVAGCPAGEEGHGIGGFPLVGRAGRGSPHHGGAGAPASPAVSGFVTRTAEIAAGRDGAGVLYIAAFSSCSLTSPLLGVAVVPDADLSRPRARVRFRIEGLPETTVHLAAFLDDDGDADPAAPRPGPGDLVYAVGTGDGVLSCVEVGPAPRERAAVKIELNAVEQ